MDKESALPQEEQRFAFRTVFAMILARYRVYLPCFGVLTLCLLAMRPLVHLLPA